MKTKQEQMGEAYEAYRVITNPVYEAIITPAYEAYMEKLAEIEAQEVCNPQ